MMLDVSQFTAEKLTDQVYRVLKQGIHRQVFKPGQRLDLAELEQQLGVSRTPVKDAINRLEVEGFIQVVPRRGTFVAAFSLEEIREYLEIRKLIETYAAERFCANVSPEDRARIVGILNEMETLYDPVSDKFTDYDAFLERDRQFHLLVVAQAGNRRLVEIYDNLKVHTQIALANRAEAYRRAATTTEEHRRIKQAIQAGDGAMLRQVVAEHLQAVEEQVLNNMALELAADQPADGTEPALAT